MARIRRLSPRLPAGQQKVVEFFVSHCERAVFLTSIQIATEIGVSEATVVRTAPALGFRGYRQFRRAFQSYFLEGMSTVTRVKLTATPRRTPGDIIDEVLQTEFENLDATRRRIDRKALENAAQLLADTRHIHIIGMRSAHSLAWLLHFSLTLILTNSRLVTLGVADVSEQLESVRRDDVVVAITFERYTRATVELFHECLERGARGIALTDKPTSPLAERAAIVLEAQTRLSSFIDSYVAPTAVINALVTLVAAKRRRTVLRALETREADWRRHGTYIDGR
jgi:DNA-binding MurR/RpiR family transcriptional regulator